VHLEVVERLPDSDAGRPPLLFVHGLGHGSWCWEHWLDGVAAAGYPAYAVSLRGHAGSSGRLGTARLSHYVDDVVRTALGLPRPAVLVGHSMGGLVARSALHQAGGARSDAHGWTSLVRDTVTLGTPHLGAPLERGVHRLTAVLARLPETRPLAALLALRSVGIKDLRHGTLVEADWSGRDLDATGAAAHTHVPLSDGARHFVVLATLTRDPSARTAALLGDLLVPPRSAYGDTGDDDRLTFPPDHVHRVGGLNHLDLLNHPLVYEQIHRWLVERPEGPRPAAP
jgi:pimeloyl-ACP methyl ester carboxylesterase